jgi:hypothetical protein
VISFSRSRSTVLSYNLIHSHLPFLGEAVPCTNEHCVQQNERQKRARRAAPGERRSAAGNRCPWENSWSPSLDEGGAHWRCHSTFFSFSPQPAVLCIGHAGIVVDRSRKSPGSRAAPRPGCGSGGAARGLGKGRTVIRRDPLLSSIQAFPSSIIVLHVAYLFIIGLKYLWRYLPRYLGT